MLDFLGIGAQKSGTCWLRHQLNNHPHLRCAEELHFWDEQRHRGVEWWLAHFPAEPDVRKGEITPAYAILDQAMIAEIRTAAPEARVFYSIRNPIDRAWSHARMALNNCKMDIDEASDQWFIDHFKSHTSRSRGAYADCLDAWLAHFPQHQFHLILFDDIVAQPRTVLRELALHLGVDPGPFFVIPEDELRQAVFPGPPAELRPALWRYLHDLYAPSVARLESRLGRRLSHWLTEPPATPP